MILASGAEGRSRDVLVDLERKFQTTRCGEDDDARAHWHYKSECWAKGGSNEGGPKQAPRTPRTPQRQSRPRRTNPER